MARKPKGAATIEKKFKTLEALETIYVDHADIIPNSYNPNRQSDAEFELLRRSMEEDGFTQPIVVVVHPDQEGKYRIVDGEHRWRCSGKLGYEKVPVVITPMTYEQARVATLRHNRARGSEDIELSAEVLRDLERVGALEHAQDSLMMDDVEIQKLLEDVGAPEGLAAEDFGEAWVPSDVAADDTAKAQEYATADGTISRSLSADAVDAQRKTMEAIKTAKTEGERQRAASEASYYRLNLVFAGEQAELIKTVLGDNQAESLYQLCVAASKTAKAK